MWSRIIALFGPRPDALKARFLARFTGRTLIVHAGLSIGWVEALLKEAGGGGHFRFDARTPTGPRPTPIEWVMHRHVLPQRLPLPLLVKVEPDRLLLRHLTRNGAPVHPSEINWMLREFPARTHLVLYAAGSGFRPERGLPVSDNRVEYDLELFS